MFDLYDDFNTVEPAAPVVQHEPPDAGYTFDHKQGCPCGSWHHECGSDCPHCNCVPSQPTPLPSDDALCSLCGEGTDHWAGNPGKWPMKLPYKGGNGKTRIYHRSCVIEAIDKMQNIAALPVGQMETFEGWWKGGEVTELVSHLEGQDDPMECYKSLSKAAWNAAKGQKETK